MNKVSHLEAIKKLLNKYIKNEKERSIEVPKYFAKEKEDIKKAQDVLDFTKKMGHLNDIEMYTKELDDLLHSQKYLEDNYFSSPQYFKEESDEIINKIHDILLNINKKPADLVEIMNNIKIEYAENKDLSILQGMCEMYAYKKYNKNSDKYLIESFVESFGVNGAALLQKVASVNKITIDKPEELMPSKAFMRAKITAQKPPKISPTKQTKEPLEHKLGKLEQKTWTALEKAAWKLQKRVKEFFL